MAERVERLESALAELEQHAQTVEGELAQHNLERAEGSAAHAEELAQSREQLADVNAVRRDWANVARSERLDRRALESLQDVEARRRANFVDAWSVELAKATALAEVVAAQAEAEARGGQDAVTAARKEAKAARAELEEVKGQLSAARKTSEADAVAQKELLELREQATAGRTELARLQEERTTMERELRDLRAQSAAAANDTQMKLVAAQREDASARSEAEALRDEVERLRAAEASTLTMHQAKVDELTSEVERLRAAEASARIAIQDEVIAAQREVADAKALAHAARDEADALKAQVAQLRADQESAAAKASVLALSTAPREELVSSQNEAASLRESLAKSEERLVAVEMAMRKVVADTEARADRAEEELAVLQASRDEEEEAIARAAEEAAAESAAEVEVAIARAVAAEGARAEAEARLAEMESMAEELAERTGELEAAKEAADAAKEEAEAFAIAAAAKEDEYASLARDRQVQLNDAERRASEAERRASVAEDRIRMAEARIRSGSMNSLTSGSDRAADITSNPESTKFDFFQLPSAGEAVVQPRSRRNSRAELFRSAANSILSVAKLSSASAVASPDKPLDEQDAAAPAPLMAQADSEPPDAHLNALWAEEDAEEQVEPDIDSGHPLEPKGALDGLWADEETPAEEHVRSAPVVGGTAIAALATPRTPAYATPTYSLIGGVQPSASSALAGGGTARGRRRYSLL